MKEAPPDTPTPRGAIGLIFDRHFGTIFWGKVLAAAGVWMHSLVAAIMVFDVTGSAAAVSLVSVAQFAPQLLLAPLSGSMADRGHASRQILLGRVFCLLGAGAMAISAPFLDRLSPAATTSVVFVTSLFIGLGFVAGNPAMQSIIPDVIRPGELATAMTLNTGAMTTARIAGPVLGALMLVHWGPAITFAGAALFHLVFLILLLVIRLPTPAAAGTGRDASVRSGLAYVRSDRPLVLLLFATSAAMLGSEPSLTLAPALAAEFGGGGGLVGAMSAWFGIGAFAGVLVLSIIQSRAAIGIVAVSRLGFALLCAGSLVVAISPWANLALAAFCVSGIGWSLSVTGLSTLIQDRSPAEYRGRIMALWTVSFVGARPIAAALLGATADLVTVRFAFILTAITMLVVAVMSSAWMVRTHQSRPALLPAKD